MVEKGEVQLVLRPRKAALKEFERAAKNDSTMTAGATL